MMQYVVIVVGLIQAALAVTGADGVHGGSSLQIDSSIESRLVRRETRTLAPEKKTEALGDTLGKPTWANTIWCYYEYPNGPTPFVKLNMETWRHHAPDMNIVMVNDTNIKELIPDLPQEYFMLPYASAKSDLLRAALLYHHGGLYTDTDFLVNRPVSEFVSKLEDHDIVTYSDNHDLPSGQCGRSFSSNFMAGRKGNGFSKTWWENLKRKLTAECPPGFFEKEIVCCHEAGKKLHQCHIPWASMEHMKDPKDAGNKDAKAWLQATSLMETNSESRVGTGVSLLVPEFVNSLPQGISLYCFAGDQTLTPHLNGEVYWQHWNPEQQQTLDHASKELYDTRFACRSDVSGRGMDLNCTKGNWGADRVSFPNFFGRIAYHLFFSTNQKPVSSKEDVMNKSWLVSEMYRRSLGLRKDPISSIAFMETHAVVSQPFFDGSDDPAEAVAEREQREAQEEMERGELELERKWTEESNGSNSSNSSNSSNATNKSADPGAPPSEKYEEQDYEFTKGVPVTSTKPTKPTKPISGSNANETITLAIYPELPPGLSFNTSTGEISGVPTKIRRAMKYTVTALNSVGISESKMNIAVFPALMCSHFKANQSITTTCRCGTTMCWEDQRCDEEASSCEAVAPTRASPDAN